jgi:hypothetical protein
MSKELEKKSAALEEALAKQLNEIKKGSEDWVKVGAVVGIGALVVYGLSRLSSKKEEKTTDKALEVLEREGLLNPDIKERLTQPKSSSLWTGLAQKVLFLGLALAKDKLFEQFFAESDKPEENKGTS